MSLTCWISELADSIEKSAIPKWLADYVQLHRNDLTFDLEMKGVAEIPCPDGKIIEVRRVSPEKREGEKA